MPRTRTDYRRPIIFYRACARETRAHQTRRRIDFRRYALFDRYRSPRQVFQPYQTLRAVTKSVRAPKRNNVRLNSRSIFRRISAVTDSLRRRGRVADFAAVRRVQIIREGNFFGTSPVHVHACRLYVRAHGRRRKNRYLI